MAFQLTRRDDGDFEGKTGRKVQISIESEDPATLVRIAYAGEEDGIDPFEFKIKKGRNVLLVSVFGVKDQRVHIAEVDGASVVSNK